MDVIVEQAVFYGDGIGGLSMARFVRFIDQPPERKRHGPAETCITIVASQTHCMAAKLE